VFTRKNFFGSSFFPRGATFEECRAQGSKTVLCPNLRLRNPSVTFWFSSLHSFPPSVATIVVTHFPFRGSCSGVESFLYFFQGTLDPPFSSRSFPRRNVCLSLGGTIFLGPSFFWKSPGRAYYIFFRDCSGLNSHEGFLSWKTPPPLSSVFGQD